MIYDPEFYDTIFMGKIATLWKVPKWLPYKSETISQNHQIFDMRMCAHVYKVSVSNPVARRAVHRR